MGKRLIDANVILRYLLQDDEGMAAEARDVIREGAATLPEVLAEVLYVLRNVYHVGRADLADALAKVCDDVEVEHAEVLLYAIEVFRETSLDFVDCILLAYHETEHVDVFTFDKKLKRQLETGRNKEL